MQFENDLRSDHKELFLKTREYLLSRDGLVETRTPRITTYRTSTGGVCHMRTMPHGIDIGFLQGAKMTDKLGRLTGNGKVMRVLPLTKFDTKTIDYYLQQAVALAAP